MFSVVLFATACSTWEADDIDGDGKTIFDGDCWESNVDPVPPEGALIMA